MPVVNKAPAGTPEYSRYHRLMQSQYPPVLDSEGNVIGIIVDAYDVFEAFDPENRTEGETHALKKLLVPGQRGAKGAIQDIKEAIRSLEAALIKRAHRHIKKDIHMP